MANSDQHLLDKLRFWHKLEFFTPFDLDNRARPQDYKKTLWRSYRDDTPLRFDNPPRGKEVARYTLFLGVFDKSDIRDVVPESSSRSENDALDEEHGADLEGRTCMASIGLSSDAVPNFDDFEVSTLPWAVGQSRKNGLQALTSEAFFSARGQLATRLHNFLVNRSTKYSEIDGKEVPDPSFTPDEVDALIDLISDWSGFRPSKERDAAMLEVVFQQQRPPTEDEIPETTDTKDENEVEDEDETPTEIGILNSFYIEDIERAIETAKTGNLPKALHQYLTPLPEEKRVDLYSDAGRERIISGLKPQHTNAGRWFANPDHAMSLMQQFAINTGLETLKDEGLFSVNGPPGTGKTTLLRDVVAENITRRAGVLADLEKPGDAFQRGNKGAISHLIPELTGFEMVVVSSNNAAVENISRDLPKSSSIWGDDLSHLQPVAHKLAAQEKGEKCRALSSEDMPWGLIAAAMGNKSNRSHFVDKVYFGKISKFARRTWSGESRPLTIWEWRDNTLSDVDKKQNFKAARQAYKTARQKVEAAISEMQVFDELNELVRTHNEESWCRAAQHSVDIQNASLKAARSKLATAGKQQRKRQNEVEDLVIEADLLKTAAPMWWQRLLLTKAARDHNDRMSQNTETQIRLRRDLSQISTHIEDNLEPALFRAEAALQQALNRLEKTCTEWRCKVNQHTQINERLGSIAPPCDLADLETDAIQINGFWHNRSLASLRSCLFKAALELHEAWLLAVSQPRAGFGKNLSELKNVLQNKFEGRDEDRLALWQSLFMIVPVVSSTFASVARQFEDLGPDSLGWLFIDEAGQAVPQAAVGALLRSRRALVIGDPLQIPPVFTLPKQLITEIANTSRATKHGGYSPDRVSAQVLADQANPFGTSVSMGGDEPIWIGSPLRVHRRCIDPMFRIANRIAYEDRMVFGMPSLISEPDKSPYFGPSSWIDLPGQVQGRQAVPVQIDYVARLIAGFNTQFGRWPDIYVISPFKEIKEQISSRLKSPGFWSELGTPKPNAKTMENWISGRVGTVHTFQGKEEDSVIMVLGADEQKEGAARWAASKPNILNVALTRAKRRFYFVGDRSLWGKLRYFQDAYRDLPVENPAEFFAKARKEWNSRSDMKQSP